MMWQRNGSYHIVLLIFSLFLVCQRIEADDKEFSFTANWTKQESSNSSDIGTDVVVNGNYVYSLSICGVSMCINKYGLDGQTLYNRTYTFLNNTVLGSNMIIRGDSMYVLATAGNDTASKIPHNITVGTLGSSDIYLVQYNESTGNFIRGVLFGTPSVDITGKVAWSDIDQSLVVIGTAYGSFDGNPFQGQLDIIVAKFAQNLTLTWSRQYGSPAIDRGISISVDNDPQSSGYGNIIALGETYGDVSSVNAGNSDILVIQVDSNGNSPILYQTGTAGLDSAGDLTHDSNYIYVLAVLQSSQVVVIQLSNGDLTPNGTFTITTSSQSFATAAITLDLDGNLLLLGYDLGFGCWFVGKATTEYGQIKSLGTECTQMQGCYISYFTCGGGITIGNTSNEFFVSACSNIVPYNNSATTTSSQDAYTISFKENLPKNSNGGKSDTTAIVLGVVFGVVGAALIGGGGFMLYKFRNKFNLKIFQSNSEPGSEPSTSANSAHTSVTPMSMSKASSSEPHWIINYNDVQMKKKIGAGGFGEVYRAKWKGSDVAVKLLISTDPSQKNIQDFFLEAEVMKKLRPHPNVVQLIGFFETPVGIVTEYVSRGSLENWLQSDKPMSDDQKIAILHGTAAGMLYLHSEGILHRDLAARNILLDKTLCPKLCDFGMSRLLIDQKTHKTLSGIGPIRWMAPEALTESKYNKKSDVWSFGVVTYEVLTRKEPYPGVNLFDVSIKVPTGEISLVSELAPRAHEFPAVLMSVLSICLQLDATWRPEFTQIVEWLESHTTTSSSMSLVYQENSNPQDNLDKYRVSRESRQVDGSFLPAANSNNV